VAELQHRVFASVDDIPAAHWDALWPPLAEGRAFYRCQESAGIEGFDFFYLGLYDGEQPVLLAPLFAAKFNMGLAMDDAGREKLARVQRHWPGLLVFKTLFCGAPTSEKGVVAVHPARRDDAAVYAALDRALRAVARQHKAWMIVFKDFMDDDAAMLAPIKPLGWFGGDSLPTAKLSTQHPSLDAYLDTLSTGTRKDMKRKLKKAEKEGRIQVEAVSDISACIDEVHRLYVNVLDNGPMRWEVLTKAFFLNFCREMPQHTVFFLYWLRDEAGGSRRLVGMNFCLHFDDRLIDKYIGMDYEVSRELNLYFISFFNNVQWCIEHGKGTYMLSQGGYPVKIQLGATLVPLRTLTRICNPVINWFANRFA
jgi:uncharacterized protein